MISSECPKCRGRMQEGFIKDDTHGGVHVSSWIEGPPEKSFWVGTKTSGKKIMPLVSFRCAKCGFVESYAKEPSPE